MDLCECEASLVYRDSQDYKKKTFCLAKPKKQEKKKKNGALRM